MFSYPYNLGLSRKFPSKEFACDLHRNLYVQQPKTHFFQLYFYEMVHRQKKGTNWWFSWRSLKSFSCIYSEYIEWWKGYKMRKSYMHTRVCEFWNTHPPSTASPFGRINLESSRATASKHRSPHSVRELVSSGIIAVEYVPTNEQRADILTKALVGPIFREHRDFLMNLHD